VIVLRFYEGLPLAEIASVLGISEGTVKSTLHRGLKELKEKLG
jgi:RNA polymerase sigma-70 factor (ECF subfamily)